jgi:hypothetical protein
MGSSQSGGPLEGESRPSLPLSLSLARSLSRSLALSQMPVQTRCTGSIPSCLRG